MHQVDALSLSGQRTARKVVLGVLFLSGCVGVVRAADAPVARRQFVALQQETQDFAGAIFVEDRTTLQTLNAARELVEQNRYSEAVRFLNAIIESSEDFWFQPHADQPVYRSVKSEAQRLIGALPREGRRSYELQFGAQGRQLLRRAVEEGDIAGVAEVSRRFFHTKASYEATHLLGIYHLDRGHPLAAALSFRRLQQTPAAAVTYEPMLSLRLAACWVRAGMKPQAQEVLTALKARYPTASFQIGGEDVRLFKDDNDSLDWLVQTVGQRLAIAATDTDEWRMFRGNGSRTATSNGSSPLLVERWRVPTTEHPRVEEIISQLHQTYTERNVTALPSMQPLVVGNVVLTRTSRNLAAINFVTGKRMWHAAADDSLDEWIDVASTPAANSNYAGQLVGALDKRFWDDATYGLLSSDGRYVFSVEDLGFSIGTNSRNVRTVIMGNGGRKPMPVGPRSFNRLAAYDLRTQLKLKWELGGPKGEFELPAAGMFFLGPPLPLMGHLYVLAEANGEIRLVSLDAATGTMEWSQPLAVVQRDVVSDPIRRTAGISPSYADGVLVCPTAAGAVVAVDLTTRSLLWGYRYANIYDGSRRNRALRALPRFNLMMQTRQLGKNVHGWVDSSVTIADGRVLLTPIESRELHCVNLIDGEQQWIKPGGDGLYLAGVHDGNAIVVGRERVAALRLANGEPAWESNHCVLPEKSTPSGRGFLSGDSYYLPLSSAEVATIDLKRGQIVARSKSRHGRVPGNLICYRGTVLSQGADFIEKFDQRSALEKRIETQLAEDPNDAKALALRGELWLHDGKFAAAIDDLRIGYGQTPDDRSRTLLVEALLGGTEHDFDAYRSAEAEILRLIERPQERSRYLRLFAAGLERADDVEAAFAHYMKLLDPNLGQPELQTVDENLEVRRDRWVQVRLASLHERADEKDRSLMESVIEDRFNKASEEASTSALRRFVDYFGNYAAADLARQRLSQRLAKDGSRLASEMLLTRLIHSTDTLQSRAAIVRWARLLHDAGRPGDAAIFYRRLAGELADVNCADGKTGRQWVEELTPEDPVQSYLSDRALWPTGNVEKVRESKLTPSYRYFPCRIQGDPGPFFQHVNILFEQGQQLFMGRDAEGQVLWKVSLIADGQRPRISVNPYVLQCRTHGHLLVVSMSQQIIAIDTLATDEPDGARVLWTKDLGRSLPGVPMNRGASARHITVPWGGQRWFVSDATGRPAGILGPVSDDMFCFQNERTLVAVDPLSGETIWKRHDLDEGSDLFGDDELLFVATPNTTEAVVVRPLDGKIMGKRQVDVSAHRMLTIGRNVLTWTARPGKRMVELKDAWEQKTIWQHEFASNAKGCLIGTEAVGILEKGDHFLILNLADGRIMVDAKIKEDQNISHITVLPSRDRYTLIVNRRFRNSKDRITIYPVPGSNPNDPANPLIDGWVYGFDRHTAKQIWAHEVIRQGIVLNQPSELPLLVFVTRVYEQKIPNRKGRERNRHYWTVMCLDKRTGRVIHDEQMNQNIGYYELAAMPEEQTVELRLQRNAIRLKFTDDPVPSDPDKADDNAQPQADKPNGAEKIDTAEEKGATKNPQEAPR